MFLAVEAGDDQDAPEPPDQVVEALAVFWVEACSGILHAIFDGDFPAYSENLENVLGSHAAAVVPGLEIARSAL